MDWQEYYELFDEEKEKLSKLYHSEIENRQSKRDFMKTELYNEAIKSGMTDDTFREIIKNTSSSNSEFDCKWIQCIINKYCKNKTITHSHDISLCLVHGELLDNMYSEDYYDTFIYSSSLGFSNADYYDHAYGLKCFALDNEFVVLCTEISKHPEFSHYLSTYLISLNNVGGNKNNYFTQPIFNNTHDLFEKVSELSKKYAEYDDKCIKEDREWFEKIRPEFVKSLRDKTDVLIDKFLKCYFPDSNKIRL